MTIEATLERIAEALEALARAGNTLCGTAAPSASDSARRRSRAGTASSWPPAQEREARRG